MNARDYRLHLDGREAAARGAGLSDSPHGGRDGDLWRGGVRSWLDEHPDPDSDENDQDGRGSTLPAHVNDETYSLLEYRPGQGKGMRSLACTCTDANKRFKNAYSQRDQN